MEGNITYVSFIWGRIPLLEINVNDSLPIALCLLSKKQFKIMHKVHNSAYILYANMKYPDIRTISEDFRLTLSESEGGRKMREALWYSAMRNAW